VKHQRAKAFRAYSEEDLDLIEEYYAMESRKSLWAFRQYIDPTMVKGWWVAEMSKQFQLFYDKLAAGKRPKMLIEAPPQHGKSRGLQDAITWMSGKNPDLKTIYGSFSDELGVMTNAFIQRIFDTDKYRRVFPDTRISSQVGREDGNWQRNSSFMEFVGRKGSFRNVTVKGQVTGKTLGLGVVDDPIKGRQEAQSKLVRDTAWNWLMDDFFSRFADEAGFIMTMTRWHVDDPAGRWLAKFPDTVVLKYPAMFIETPDNWKNDAYDPRSIGEPLFPEYKSKAFLEERRGAYTVASWQSLYQQMPIVSGGGMFPVTKFKKSQVLPTKDEIKKAVRYWDKAGTEAGGAYTSGTLMLWLKTGQFYVASQVRGQWSSLEREQTILQTAQNDAADWGRVEIWLEQEPGSGGKESAERSVAMLAGYPAKADKVSGSKEIRAEPYAAQQQAGHVTLYDAKWTQEFIDEHESFPNGKYKDQVDSAAGAFAKCVVKTYKYDATMNWVGSL
jgi:predicted phage terminase large subunit-like protein